MSDVEPDDPVPVTTDQNANVVQSKTNKTVCTVPSADVPPPNIEPPSVEPIVISSDENNGVSDDKTVEKIVDDDELNAMEAEIAENLWGVTFNIPEAANFELGFKHPSQVGGISDFGIHELTWQPTLSEMWMDVTDWTDSAGQGKIVTQDEGVRPDSTMGDNAPCDPAVATIPVQDDPPLEVAKTAEETETLSLDDMPLNERVRMINVTDVVDVDKGRISENKPEMETGLVPTVIVSLSSAGNSKKKTYLTPPPKSDEENGEEVIGPTGPVMRVTSETIVEIDRRGNDPRLGYGTTYFWRNRPDMKKYYELQTEFPTLSGASKFGLNFVTESEEERNRQLHVTGPRPTTRERFTQTSPIRRQSIAIQF